MTDLGDGPENAQPSVRPRALSQWKFLEEGAPSPDRGSPDGAGSYKSGPGSDETRGLSRMACAYLHAISTRRAGSILVGAVGVVGLAGAGGQEPGASAPASAATAAKSATDPVRSQRAEALPYPPAVLQVYRASCVQCHDVDGRGEIARDTLPKIPDFTEPKWQAGRTDAELSRSILDGKGKSMPRMKDKLGSVDVRQMVALVRGFRGGAQVVEDEPEEPVAPERPAAGANPTGAVPRSAEPPPPETAAAERSLRDGSRLFQRSCAMCHGSDGRGSGVRETMPAIPDFTAPAWHQRRTDSQLITSILEGKGTNMPAFRDKVNRDQARDLVAFLRRFAPGAAPQPAAAAPDDFEVRFRQLLEEFLSLRRQSMFAAPPWAQPRSQATGER